jgi:NAD kinase
VPLAPFKRAFDPMVISAQREIRVSTEEQSHLLIDGQQLFQLKEKTPVTIRKHAKKMAFAEVRK